MKELLKTCCICRREYPPDLFASDLSSSDSLDSACRLCNGTIKREATAGKRRGDGAPEGRRRARRKIAAWRDGGWKGFHPYHSAPGARRSTLVPDPYAPSRPLVGPTWMVCIECGRRLADHEFPARLTPEGSAIRTCRTCERFLNRTKKRSYRAGRPAAKDLAGARGKIRRWQRREWRGDHPGKRIPDA